MEYDLLRYEGDMKPAIRLTIYDGGDPASLPDPGTTVTFTMTEKHDEAGTPVLSGSGSVVDGPSGVIEYSPGSGDAYPAGGTYSAWFTIDTGNGPESWPAEGYLTVLVLAT